MSKAASTGMQRHLPMIQGIAIGLLVITATPSAILCAALLMPTILAMMADRLHGRPVGRTVLLFGLAGACGPEMTLWRSGRGMEGAIALATDVHTLALSWSFQAGGWLLAQILSLGICFYVETMARIEITALEKRRAATAAQWPD
jgi:hypothetical protein